MTFDPDPLVDGEAGPDGVGPSRGAAGHMVSLRFLRTALRRRRWLWTGLAVVGLVAGLGYHVVVPVKYSATATLFLASPPGTDQTVASANNLAMLDTAAVGRRAVDQLHEPGLTPSTLLGKAPGTAVSDDVLAITTSGPDSAEAVRRANAVADAYLAFRAQQYESQNDAVVQAAGQQIHRLEAQITTLTTQIDALGTGAQSQQATALATERSALTSQVTGLRQSVQSDDFDTLSVTKGSRVITGATPAETSKKKVFLLDGLTGLVVGLALGLGIVLVPAILSDRLRRREDVAAVLGVPVAVSVGRIGRRRPRPTPLWILHQLASPDARLRTVVRYLGARLAHGRPRPAELVVAVDDAAAPAAAVLALACQEARAGRTVALVDATSSRPLAQALGRTSPGVHRVEMANGPTMALYVAPLPWASGAASMDGEELAALADADAVLVLATVDTAVGCWHLRAWSTEAVVTVTVGRSTAQRMDAVAELLQAAGVTVVSAVLLGADADDESVGLPDPWASAFRRRMGLVEPDAALLA